jgi:hypothetical protein
MTDTRSAVRILVEKPVGKENSRRPKRNGTVLLIWNSNAHTTL